MTALTWDTLRWLWGEPESAPGSPDILLNGQGYRLAPPNGTYDLRHRLAQMAKDASPDTIRILEQQALTDTVHVSVNEVCSQCGESGTLYQSLHTGTRYYEHSPSRICTEEQRDGA